jgi:hypothetical protein
MCAYQAFLLALEPPHHKSKVAIVSSSRLILGASTTIIFLGEQIQTAYARSPSYMLFFWEPGLDVHGGAKSRQGLVSEMSLCRTHHKSR